jgi:hypothetical protein
LGKHGVGEWLYGAPSHINKVLHLAIPTCELHALSDSLLGSYENFSGLMLLFFLNGLFIFSGPLCEDCLVDRGTSHSALYSEKELRFPSRLNSNVAFSSRALALYYFRLSI